MKAGDKVTVLNPTGDDPQVIIIRPRVIVDDITPEGVMVRVPLSRDIKTGKPLRFGPFPADRLMPGWPAPVPNYVPASFRVLP